MATAKRRFRWGFVVLGAVALALVLWTVLHKTPKPPQKAPVVAVSVARATVQDVTVSITDLGAAQAWKSDTIVPQVSGKLLSANFTEGTPVKAGQLLAVIDPAPFRAALLQAQGALVRDEALLDAARVDLRRYQTLSKQDSIAGQQLDTQAAVVKQDQGVVMIDQGAVAAARVNLNYARITSPIGGRTGVRLIDPGNVVTAGTTTGIVIVNQIDPIAVTFTVPQGDFQRLSELSDDFHRPLVTTASSQETGAVLGRGQLSIADNKVDPNTGTVELKARFPNPGGKLWPGQFVNVNLSLQTLRNVTTVPAAAVNQGPSGSFVFILGSNGRAVMRPVKVGWTEGAVAVITQGVQPGDLVVTDGQMTLKSGSLARVRQAPAANAPAESAAS
jgi:multidrug efflux system membrane fusion protein